MPEYIVKIEDGNGNDVAYTSTNEGTLQQNIEKAGEVFQQDVRHGTAVGPGKVVGYSAYDWDVLK